MRHIDPNVGDLVRYTRNDDILDVQMIVLGYVTYKGEYEIDPKTYYHIEWFNHPFVPYGRYVMEPLAMNEKWEVIA